MGLKIEYWVKDHKVAFPSAAAPTITQNCLISPPHHTTHDVFIAVLKTPQPRYAKI